jgi:hypothetical protein
VGWRFCRPFAVSFPFFQKSGVLMNKDANSRMPLRAIFIYPLAALLLVGCTKSASISGTSPVTGKVTYNGIPVEGATVTFVGEGEQRPATGVTEADGTYELTTLDAKGALPGKYVALVRKTEMPAELTREVSMEEAAQQAGKPLPAPKELLPAKYANPTESPHKFEVTASGANTFDLPLTD